MAPTAADAMPALAVLCRAGFEADLVSEFRQLCGDGLEVCHAARNGGCVLLTRADGALAREFARRTLAQSTFARQWYAAGPAIPLAGGDRVTPVCEALQGTSQPYGAVRLAAPDSAGGQALARLLRKLAPPMRAGLRRAGLLDPDAGPTLHLLFATEGEVWPCVALPTGSPHPEGIPRLRALPQAPSRAAAKLEEAFVEFRFLEGHGAGRSAVDLGAAPGGWSFVLAARGFQVTAVDHGRLAPQVMATGLVVHRAADAFTFAPDTPVHTLVADIADKPLRVADLLRRWLRRGWCRQAVVNLKLPMQERQGIVQRCRTVVADVLPEASRLAIRQLYHDRREVTLAVRRGGAETAGA